MQIRRIFGKMMALLPNILPQFKSQVDFYLHSAWNITLSISVGLLDAVPTDLPEDYFSQYVIEKEDRLRKNLEKVHYDLEEPDTIRVVIDGPLERVSSARGACSFPCPCSNDLATQSILPLLYLLLKRHLHLVYFARVPEVSSFGLEAAIESAWSAMRSIRREHELRAKDVAGMWFCCIMLLLRILTKPPANFHHQRRDSKQEFRLFACGLVN
jgi:hypothetical protein